MIVIHFRKMLALGSSKPWPDALEIITGQRKMEASALVEYFKPLQDWLEKKNKETGAHIGWDSNFGMFHFEIFQLNCTFLMDQINFFIYLCFFFLVRTECLSKVEDARKN